MAKNKYLSEDLRNQIVNFHNARLNQCNQCKNTFLMNSYKKLISIFSKIIISKLKIHEYTVFTPMELKE